MATWCSTIKPLKAEHVTYDIHNPLDFTLLNFTNYKQGKLIKLQGQAVRLIRDKLGCILHNKP